MVARHHQDTAADHRDDGDEALLNACRQGRQAAWDAIVDRYGRLVHSIPRRLGLREADCDDVFQNVFQTLFERLDSIRDADRLPGWLATTARRRCWRLMRTAGRAVPDAMLEREDPGHDAIERWESQEILRRALEQLSDRDRELLTACFATSTCDGYREIAETLGMPIGSVGPTRARAFRRLSRILQDMGYAPHECAA